MVNAAWSRDDTHFFGLNAHAAKAAGLEAWTDREFVVDQTVPEPVLTYC